MKIAHIIVNYPDDEVEFSARKAPHDWDKITPDIEKYVNEEIGKGWTSMVITVLP